MSTIIEPKSRFLELLHTNYLFFETNQRKVANSSKYLWPYYYTKALLLLIRSKYAHYTCQYFV